MARGTLCVTLALCLLVNTFGLPTDVLRLRRDNENSIDVGSTSKETGTSSTLDPFDDDDDFAEPVSTSSGGGSSIFSLLNLATALFPGSSGSTTTIKLRKILQKLLIRYQSKLHLPIRRQNNNHVIEIDYATQLKPPPPPQFEKQVSDESDSSASSESSDSSSESTENNGNASTASDDNNNGASDSRSDENNAAEESVESTNDNGNSAKQSSDSNSSDSEEEDYSDEIPGGDGQGGGILGLLAGLSGGENGESDLGSLLAAVSGIVVNLSGDGFDLNSLIGSGIGLFAGLLSEGEENPGSVVASYLLTSLDTITGGGSKNNGAFFGNLISKLVKGTSAAGESESSEEESNENKMPMADSAGFIISLLMSILGDMSKGSSDGSNAW